MKNAVLLLFSFFGFFPSVFSQSSVVERVEPMFWWTDMHESTLQIMLHGENIGRYSASIKSPGIIHHRTVSGDSPNYLFLYVEITDEAKVGTFPILLSNGEAFFTLDYELKSRDPNPRGRQGFDSKDVIYLMMPDRFANGNPNNDTIDGFLEVADRSNPNGRHGGDIAGVMKHLDYIDNLGMTAIWFTPVFENNMSADYGAYHGYAATDLYQIDQRYGTNEEFVGLVNAVHDRGMKVIMDMIHNHVGDKHWWMDDLPFKDWLNDKERYGLTNYRGAAVTDPYASEKDFNSLTKGWFVTEMPDLNQKNEVLADYLIQNTLWWIEYSQVDGIRMDTYVYPDKDYMARWAKEVLEAYPQFNIVGEAWVNYPAQEAFWQQKFKGSPDNYESYLPSVTDFPLEYAIRDAFITEEGWLTGVRHLYYTLSQDFLYHNPMKNVIFLDNHDLGRFYNQIGKDFDHFKMAYAFLMTTRGIPQVYYGTELAFEEIQGLSGHPSVRADMPGGWKEDKRSVFTKKGRTKQEQEMHEYATTLTQWRKTRVSIHEGSLKHFIPNNNIYVYFRTLEDEVTMVVMNVNDKEMELDLRRFEEVLKTKTKYKNVVTKETGLLKKNMKIPSKTTLVLEVE